MKKTKKNINAEFEEEPKKEKGSLNPVDIINGNIFTKDVIMKQIPFALFLVCLAIFNIWNGYNTKKILRETRKVENELKQLRSEQIAVSSELMIKSRQSSVINTINEFELGLKELTVPPNKLIIISEKVKNEK